MKNFSDNMAKEFLISGFKQISLEPRFEVLDYAVKKLDGIPGWLTLFGVRCRDKNDCSKRIVDEAASEAGKLVRQEVLKVVAFSRRYGLILNFLARMGEANLSQIKSAIEIKEDRLITNRAVSTFIRNLFSMGIIREADGKYSISDSLLVEGIKEESILE